MYEEIDAIQGAIDSKRAAEPSWAAAEIADVRRGSATLHERNACDRLERAHEHAGSLTFRLAR
jgi:hypothetical protein